MHTMRAKLKAVLCTVLVLAVTLTSVAYSEMPPEPTLSDPNEHVITENVLTENILVENRRLEFITEEFYPAPYFSECFICLSVI